MTQDWEPVVIRKKAPNSAAKRDEKTVNAARRSGADIESVKKCLFLLLLDLRFLIILSDSPSYLNLGEKFYLFRLDLAIELSCVRF